MADQPGQTGRRRPNLRWAGSELAFSLSDRKLVVTRRNRPELAHLTVSWGHASGAIDIHLTSGHEAAMAGDRDKTHEPLFVVSPEALRLAGHSAERFMHGDLATLARRSLRRYRPGWLARRGYVVVLAGHHEFSGLVQRAAPKVGGKYRVKLSELANPAAFAAMLGDNIYSPEILAWPADVARIVGRPERDLVVAAVLPQREGPNHADSIMLRYGPGPTGVIGWCGLMIRKGAALPTMIRSVFLDWFEPRMGPLLVDALDRVVTGMALHEIDDLRPRLDRIRRFMRDPETAIASNG
jgi:hypothetical protein